LNYNDYNPSQSTPSSFSEKVEKHATPDVEFAAGYQFSKYFSLEVSYQQADTIHADEINSVLYYVYSYGPNLSFRSVNTQSLGARAIGTIPIYKHLSGYVGAGAASESTKETEVDRYIVPLGNPSTTAAFGPYSTRVWRAQYMAGLGFSVTKTIAFRLGWDRPISKVYPLRMPVPIPASGPGLGPLGVSVAEPGRLTLDAVTLSIVARF
jgi:hypothetical protein